MQIEEAFRRQAEACFHLGSPMYGALLSRLSEDLAAGGVAADVMAGHETDPGPSALALRLMGSVHRLVLERRAQDLAVYYPSVGGTWDEEAGWAAFQRLLAAEPEAVREWLDRPPQTNEVGRAGALMGGLLHLEHRLPVRLYEIGASGGLNLAADRFCYVDASGTTYGDPLSAVRLEEAWQGRPLGPWPDLQLVDRVGCDVMPVDVTTTEGRLTLTAYVWPDQTVRHERLRGALAIAQQVRPTVRRQGAADFVDTIELRAGTTTVLWHSVMWQYLPTEEQETVTASIERLGEAASEQAPFAHLFLEPTRRTPDSPHDFLVVLTEWPTGERRILGDAHPHGVPATWD